MLLLLIKIFLDGLLLQLTNTKQIFYGATAFNQALAHGNSWNLENVTDMTSMFYTAFSIANYDIFLYSQANNPGIESNITIDVSSKYCDSTSRTFLTGTKNWTINDSGASSDCNKFVSTWAVSSGSFELPLKDYTTILLLTGEMAELLLHTLMVISQPILMLQLEPILSALR